MPKSNFVDVHYEQLGLGKIVWCCVELKETDCDATLLHLSFFLEERENGNGGRGRMQMSPQLA